MICHQPVSFQPFCSSFGNDSWDCVLIERQFNIFGTLSFVMPLSYFLM